MYISKSLANINNGDLMNLFIVCILVFCSRIVDVSLGTIRTTIVVKGKNVLGSLIGFIEITVWFVVVEQILNSTENNIWIILAYALGFSVGTYIGGKLTSVLFKIKLSVQIITAYKSQELIDCLRENGFAVAVINVNSLKNKKYLFFLEIDSNHLNELRRIIEIYDPKAFYTVSETLLVKNGYFGLNK